MRFFTTRGWLAIIAILGVLVVILARALTPG